MRLEILHKGSSPPGMTIEERTKNGDVLIEVFTSRCGQSKAVYFTQDQIKQIIEFLQQQVKDN